MTGAVEMDQQRRFDGRRPGLLRLWAVASGFWTIAVLVRIRDRFPAAAGWRGAMADRWTWVGVLAPPIVLAAIMATIYFVPIALRREPRR